MCFVGQSSGARSCKGDWCEQGPGSCRRSPASADLGMRVEELFKAGDERWSALLANWLIHAGCVRYAHLTRSEPRILPHGHCAKGKQQQPRGGFDFAIPPNFRTGFAWAQHMLDRWKKLPASKQRSCGYCFNAEGNHRVRKSSSCSMRGRQARKTCHQHIGSVPWHGQNPWAVSWSGITPNGMSQHTSYTQGCCLASPLP